MFVALNVPVVVLVKMLQPVIDILSKYINRYPIMVGI